MRVDIGVRHTPMELAAHPEVPGFVGSSWHREQIGTGKASLLPRYLACYGSSRPPSRPVGRPLLATQFIASELGLPDWIEYETFEVPK